MYHTMITPEVDRLSVTKVILHVDGFGCILD